MQRVHDTYKPRAIFEITLRHAAGWLGLVLAAQPAYASAPFAEYPLPDASGPIGIATGHDGTIWFTEAVGKIGKITPAGIIAEHQTPTANSAPVAITAGADGNMWFTEENANQIGSITPSGTITEYYIPTPDSRPYAITGGHDGNVWFTELLGDKIGVITPGGAVTEYPVQAGAYMIGIADGPDGNVWFTNSGYNTVGRITPTGVISQFAVPTRYANPSNIIGGGDGNVWFTEQGSGKIGKITPAGAITEYNSTGTNTSPIGMTRTLDGNIWFGVAIRGNEKAIGRITPSGIVTEYPYPLAGPYTYLNAMTTDRAGNLWFTIGNHNAIGTISPDALSGQVSVPEYTPVYLAVASGTAAAVIAYVRRRSVAGL